VNVLTGVLTVSWNS